MARKSVALVAGQALVVASDSKSRGAIIQHLRAE